RVAEGHRAGGRCRRRHRRRAGSGGRGFGRRGRRHDGRGLVLAAAGEGGSADDGNQQGLRETGVAHGVVLLDGVVFDGVVRPWSGRGGWGTLAFAVFLDLGQRDHLAGEDAVGVVERAAVGLVGPLPVAGPAVDAIGDGRQG